MALPTIETILYATSLGKHTSPVFRYTLQLARSLNAKIIMLHVVEPIGEMGSALIQNYLPQELINKLHDEGVEQIHQQMQERIERFCQQELDNLPTQEINVEYAVVEDNHTDGILAKAKACQADLIVMGAENRFGHHSHTAEKVIRQSKIPVVVVPTGKAFD